MRNGELSEAPEDAEIRTAFPLFSPPRERGTGLRAGARRRALEVSREPTRAGARESERSNRNPIVDAWVISDVHRVETSARPAAKVSFQLAKTTGKPEIRAGLSFPQGRVGDFVINQS